MSGRLPISRAGVITGSLELPDRTFDKGRQPQASFAAVSAGYFRTLGIELRSGRLFEATELDTGAPVALIDDALAETL